MVKVFQMMQPARLISWLGQHLKQDLAITILRTPQTVLDKHLTQRQWLDYSLWTMMLLWWCFAFSVLILSEVSVLVAVLGSVLTLFNVLISLFFMRLYFRFCCFVLRINTEQDLITHLFKLACIPLQYLLLPSTLLISAGVIDWTDVATGTKSQSSLAVYCLVQCCNVMALALLLRCLYVFMLGFHQAQCLTFRRSMLLWMLVAMPLLVLMAIGIHHRLGVS